MSAHRGRAGPCGVLDIILSVPESITDRSDNIAAMAAVLRSFDPQLVGLAPNQNAILATMVLPDLASFVLCSPPWAPLH
jgi:hypothetical protein